MEPKKDKLHYHPIHDRSGKAHAGKLDLSLTPQTIASLSKSTACSAL